LTTTQKESTNLSPSPDAREHPFFGLLHKARRQSTLPCAATPKKIGKAAGTELKKIRICTASKKNKLALKFIAVAIS
jgi:hypothetical protein